MSRNARQGDRQRGSERTAGKDRDTATVEGRRNRGAVQRDGSSSPAPPPASPPAPNAEYGDPPGGGPGEERPEGIAPYREPRAIRIQRRGEQPFELPIYADLRYSFGRERTCDVVFVDETVSRLHGVLSYQSDGRWVYRDMGSSNGSWLSERLAVDPDVREEVERIPPGRSCIVEAGQSVVLANRSGRISLLAELPATTAREAADPGSPATEKLRREIELNARHHLPVFLLGPTGSGKTWAARRIHEQSGAPGSFVAVNCGALSSDINSLKSELLGHAKGAFSGATGARLGKLPHAKNGTLFLDEVESLNADAQAFLLDLLDGTGDFSPLGSPADHEVPPPPFRLVSASKRPLRQSALREDLCNRLARGGIIRVPGLDERREDIPQLVTSFVEKANAEQRMNVWFDPEAVAVLQAQAWPDNVRGLEGVVLLLAELANARRGSGRAGATTLYREVKGRLLSKRMDRVVVWAEDVREYLRARADAFGPGPHPPVLPSPPPRLEPDAAAVGVFKRPKDYTREELEAALEANAGNLTHTARSLGMVVNTLKARMGELGLRRG